jgi:type I restriction enzyme R subunit
LLIKNSKPKKADYVLYINRNKPIAIVEAKDNNHSVSYAFKLGVRLAIEVHKDEKE